MDHHFRAFSFVDRITAIEPGVRISGSYAIPAALADGRLEAAAGEAFSAATSQVMVCGNPEMVLALSAALEARGLAPHKRKAPGQVHVERYW
jgi:ferredoxin--NADP+ reductase